MKAKTVGIGAGVVVVLAIIGGAMSGGDTPVVETTTTVAETTVAETTTTVEQTTTTEPTISEADLQIMAMRMSLDLDELCPLMNALIGPLSKAEVVAFAMREFQAGFGEQLEPEAFRWLEDQFNSC
jgi:hypothetical protein